MAENTVGMRIEERVVGGVGTIRNRARMPRVGEIGVIAAALVVLLIAGVAMHQRGASTPSTPAASRTITGQQARFLGNNTTTLPNAVTADIRPVVATTAQQRFLEVNTTMLPDAVAAWLPTGTPNYYGEELTPTIGHPR